MENRNWSGLPDTNRQNNRNQPGQSDYQSISTEGIAIKNTVPAPEQSEYLQQQYLLLDVSLREKF